MKKGRAVAELLFMVERTGMQMPLDDLLVIGRDEAGPSDASPQEEALAMALVANGVAESKARQLVATYDEERIRENVAHVGREYEAGKVKSVAAYLIRAIEEDYRPKKAQHEPRREEEAAVVREREARQQALGQLNNDWNRYRERRVRERFLALGADQQATHRAAFVDGLRDGNPLIYRQYKKDGFASRMVEAQFFADLREQLLTSPEELSFEVYRERHGEKGQGADGMRLV